MMDNMFSNLTSMAQDMKTKMLGTPLQIKAHEATNDEIRAPHGQDLQELAEATYNFQDCRQIMPIFFKKLECAGKQWRQCYKSLLVLEFLSTRGPYSVVDEVKEHLYLIDEIAKTFKYRDEKGVDQGLNVRERAKKLYDLITNDEALDAEREKAAVTREKIYGSNNNYYSGGGSRSAQRSGYGGGGYDDFVQRKPKPAKHDTEKLALEREERNYAEKIRQQEERKQVASTIQPIAAPSAAPVVAPGRSRATAPVKAAPSSAPLVKAPPSSLAKAPANQEGFPEQSQDDAFADFNPRGTSQQEQQQKQQEQQQDFFSFATPPEQQQQGQLDFFQQSFPPQQQQTSQQPFQSQPQQQMQQQPFQSQPQYQQSFQTQSQQQMQQPFQSQPQQQMQHPFQQQQSFQQSQQQSLQVQPQNPAADDPFGDFVASAQQPQQQQQQQPQQQQQSFDMFSDFQSTPAAAPAQPQKKKTTEENFLGDLAGVLGGLDITSGSVTASPKGRNVTGGTAPRSLAQLANQPPGNMGGNMPQSNQQWNMGGNMGGSMGTTMQQPNQQWGTGGMGGSMQQPNQQPFF